MNIYFAVSDKMFARQNTTMHTGVMGHYTWVLSYGSGKYGESFIGSALAATAGDILNSMKKFEIAAPFTICQATIGDDILVDALRAALVGDVVWEANIVITEWTRVGQ